MPKPNTPSQPKTCSMCEGVIRPERNMTIIVRNGGKERTFDLCDNPKCFVNYGEAANFFATRSGQTSGWRR